MSKGRTRQAYWLEKNTLWQSSGLSQHQFCEQHGLVYGQFVYWRGRLNRNNAMNTEAKLLRVSTTPSQAIAEPTSCLEVILPGGIKLYIKSDADIGKATMLIQLLGGVR